MAKVNVYLNFDGNCEEAFNFYKSAFGGEFASINRFSEMPPQEGMPPLSESAKNKIMHVGLPISEETAIMGSDVIEGFGPPHTAGNNFSISLNPDSREDADKLFAALSDGGTVTMPMQDAFWEAYFGMWTDKFGINWMINMDTSSAK